ncbi:phosphoribosylaminoimidazole-succinocarboxamide synthase [Sedimentibacter acidaminivorans]|jgi:phosphoribosylaminoimidazole-succinocarboxamide synthase|uniref:Phosphoribosylaminoimidazole-succinocarboxamide synthase n=1 Tax=Sedimentibacter acidaminivorans TaxID=913099 RepID=A0ABS4GHF7_9FIRM|nr:phosphoribosylaminoimidazolesuccinocarboxamide synthase [Sedimentibacter acidaminivorans]MBP1927123.1 phosphoribosylaminoimidazole-succinocarboxamide synthase [Sedimentibacter acidaminivorans]
MEKLEMLYEGKAKKVYKTNNDKQYIVDYKDDATAFNGVKKGTIIGKGVVNNKMSAALFSLLEENGIPTHQIELLSDRESLVKAVTILPLEVIVRNVSAGSLAQRLGIEEGIPMKETVLEFSYKNDDLGDPMINDYHIFAMEFATREQLDLVKKYALKVNEILSKFFLERNIKLIDFKLEFGLYDGQVILADEISPDTCRLWDAETNKKLDKDRFRRDMGGVEEVYQEVLNRISKK